MQPRLLANLTCKFTPCDHFTAASTKLGMARTKERPAAHMHNGWPPWLLKRPPDSRLKSETLAVFYQTPATVSSAPAQADLRVGRGFFQAPASAPSRLVNKHRPWNPEAIAFTRPPRLSKPHQTELKAEPSQAASVPLAGCLTHWLANGSGGGTGKDAAKPSLINAVAVNLVGPRLLAERNGASSLLSCRLAIR